MGRGSVEVEEIRGQRESPGDVRARSNSGVTLFARRRKNLLLSLPSPLLSLPDLSPHSLPLPSPRKDVRFRWCTADNAQVRRPRPQTIRLCGQEGGVCEREAEGA